MSKVPAELDQLMWTLVESRNDAAIDEFLVRHPELRQEVGRRSVMVAGLKSLKPESRVDAKTPRFHPPVTKPSLPKGQLIAVGTLGLAALGFASFTVIYLLTPAPKPIQVVQPAPPFAAFTTADLGPSYVPPPVSNEQAPTPKSTAKLASPISITISGAPLSTVLQAIGAQAGVDVVIAPGMQADGDVDVAYQNVSATEIFRDLGLKNGFTAFDQGDGSVIIVPANAPRDMRRTGG